MITAYLNDGNNYIWCKLRANCEHRKSVTTVDQWFDHLRKVWDAGIRTPLNVTLCVHFLACYLPCLRFYRICCAILCCFLGAEMKCWRANFENLSSVWQPDSLSARPNIAQNKQRLFPSLLLYVTSLSFYLKHDVNTRISCDMAPFLMLNYIPTFRRSPPELDCIDIVDGDRVLRNVDYDLPIDTAQYTKRLESLSAQLWNTQISHEARCVFFKVGTESLNIIQVDLLLQRVK